VRMPIAAGVLVTLAACAVRAEEIRIIERTTEPLLKADRPWESFCIGYTQVIRDAGGAWHMWYESYDQSYRNDADGMLCYARSTDGVRWDKPNLGLVEYGGSTDNNILVSRSIHGHCVFLDENAPPAERFKAVFIDGVGEEWWVFGATSPDGMRWTRLAQPLLKKNSDTQVVCFRDAGGVYRLYVRMWSEGLYRGKRLVGYAESKTFGDVPDPVAILSPDANDPADLHFYNPATSKLRDGLYVMFPSAFYTGDDTVRPHLAISKDGKTFERVGRKEFLPMGKGFDSKSIYVGPGAVPAEKPGEYWLYYVASAHGHDASVREKTKYAGGIGRFRIAVGER
jgi:hypothetical protein